MINPDSSDFIIEIENLKTSIGGTDVHTDINLKIKRGEILVIVGGSGTGKTVLLHELLALRRPTSGSIRIFGQELTNANADTLLSI